MLETGIIPDVVPFESAGELRNAHSDLLKKLERHLAQGAGEKNKSAALAQLEPEIRRFLERGAATGVYLDEINERTACQVLLDYWVSSLTRAGIQVSGVPLAEFDGERLPVLNEEDCPYAGLKAITDETYFYGRESNTRELLEMVKDHSLVVVHGASGSGKSSLVMGGILPVLKAKGGTPELLIVPIFTPGNAVLDHLVKAVLQVCQSKVGSVPEEVTLLRQDALRLCAMVGGENAPPTLITLDQFEEVFTLSAPADREALAANLVEFLKANRGHRVILTVREEFKNRIVELRALSAYLVDKPAWYSMRPMTYEELKSAIEKPAKKVNLQFQPGIVDELVKKVLGQDAALPLLQFTLRSLWKKRKRNRITWEVYNALGDPLKTLEKSADEFFDSQIWENQAEIKRILLELVRVDELLEAYRQPVLKSSLLGAGQANTEEVLKLLAEKDYVHIAPGTSDASTVVEVKHESLIRNWPKFVSWIDEKRRKIRERIALTQAAKRWAEKGKQPEGLLTRSQLEDVRGESDLSELEKEFIQASTEEVDRRQREQEAALRREAEQARATAMRLRRRLIYTVVCFVLALVAFSVAYMKSKEAAQKSEEAAQKSNEARQQSELATQKSMEAYLDRMALLALQQRETEMKLEEERLQREKTRLALEAANLEKERATKRLETMEDSLTHGQIEMFRKMAPSITNKWDYTNHARNVFGSVATYLWSKGDDRGLDKLVSILRDSAKDIPDDYGVERLPAYVMPFVDKDANWPLTVRYNPNKFNDQRLLFEWRSMAISLTRSWGIPVPMRLKIETDPDVSENEIVIIADTSSKDKKEKEPSKFTVNLTTQRGQVLVSAADLPERLQRFYKDHKKEWTPLAQETKAGSPWYLVPNWTQPLWQVANRTCNPIEQAAALVVATSLLEHPELILTPECVQFMLNRLEESHPDTVKEALLARKGFKGIAEDLREIVKEDRGLNGLEYLLDALARYPKLPPSEAVKFSIEDQFGEPLPYRLPGIQARGTATAVGQRPGSLTGSGGEASDAPSGEKLPRSYQQAYEEAVPWLSPVENPIRVYVGDRIASQFITPKRELKPELMDEIAELRKDISKQFGITIPGVKFYDFEENLDRDSVRIEMVNQTRKDQGAEPIRLTGYRALEELIEELRWRCVELRNWWLTAEKTSKLRDDLPEYLRRWLEETYTLTDLKLILRAIIFPDKAISEIPPEHTLDHLPWLLGSLVFWTNVTDPLNAMGLASYLRETQHARLNSVQEKITDGRVAELIKSGIEQYHKERIQLAKDFFDRAIRLDRAAASRIFVSLYSQNSQVTWVDELRRIEELSSLPAPGRIASAEKTTPKDRNEVEEFLRKSGSQISPEKLRRFQLWLLWSYSGDKGDKKAGELRKRLLAEWNPKGWSADESYTLAYLMLKAHGELMTRPEHLHEIREMLHRAFKEFKDNEAEGAFDELSSVLYKKNRRTPVWYVSLLGSLVELHPQSFWIPFRLGSDLALESRYTQKEIESALALLDRAQSNLQRIESADQKRLRAWLDYCRMAAYLELSFYRDQERLLNQALNLLTDLKGRVEAGKGWPDQSSPYYSTSYIHLRMGKIDQAMAEVQSGLKRFPEDEDLQLMRCFLILAKGEVSEALELAQDRLDRLTKEDPGYSEWLRYATFLRVLTGKVDLNDDALRYLEASHEIQDFVRMMLYWALSRQHRGAEAQKVLSERWTAIQSSDWPLRLEQGDKKAWGEMLLAYYAGKIGRDEVFGPLEDIREFEKSKLTTIGQSFLVFQNYYFYDALLQEVTGDPADRKERALKILEKVVEAQQTAYFEYHMARYLINQLKGK